MGKSASCLRIIPCGGGDPDEAGGAGQTKVSKAKKGWSFRKRSSSGRAVSNSLVTETPSPGHKENLESAPINVDAANESVVTEKESALQLEEKKPPPTSTDFGVSDAVTLSADEKHPAAVDLYTPNNAYVSETEKHNGSSNLDVAEAASVPETERQRHAAALCVTDAPMVYKTEFEAVLAMHEPDVIIIQSAVRGFLERKEQLKQKSVVKLQAAVRGHLVRCHAVGALRCVQAIAKMQVLVRARYARLTSEECSIESSEKGNGTRKDCKPPKSYPEIMYTSMTELLKNSFARQLLESSPKSRPIKIKCDPLSRDSSWVWLERWMSLASPGSADDPTTETEIGREVKNSGKELEENFIEKEQEEKITVEDYLFHEENEIFLDAKEFPNSGTSSDFSKSEVIEEANPINSGEIRKSNSKEDSLSASTIERQKPETMGEVDVADSPAKIDSVNFPAIASETIRSEIISAKENPGLEQAREPETELEKIKTEVGDEEVVQLLETEEKNIVSDSKESARLVTVEPEIVSKLAPSGSTEYYDSKPELESVSQDTGVEEPISNSNSAKETSQGPIEKHATVPNQGISVPQNGEAEELVPHSSEFDLIIEAGASSGEEIIINHRELSLPDNLTFQVGESECGTELSVTSTLDSPDRSETGPVESERMEAETHLPKESNVVEVEVKTESRSVEKEKHYVVNGESPACATAVDIILEEKEPEANASNVQLQPDAAEEKNPNTRIPDLPEGVTEKGYQASPGSQVTFSESQGTPSSQVSVSTNPKRAKSEKSGSIKKRMILSTAKRSPLNSNNDSGGKSSADQLHKDQKSVKRRTSFGSPKPDLSDQEQGRDSSASSSLPSYMQATLSARAKANAGRSPHSSPDVADNSDVFLRKRHSLSGAKDRQDSPRLGRTSSQAQSGTKSNGTSPLERKWQR